MARGPASPGLAAGTCLPCRRLVIRSSAQRGPARHRIAGLLWVGEADRVPRDRRERPRLRSRERGDQCVRGDHQLSAPLMVRGDVRVADALAQRLPVDLGIPPGGGVAVPDVVQVDLGETGRRGERSGQTMRITGARQYPAIRCQPLRVNRPHRRRPLRLGLDAPLREQLRRPRPGRGPDRGPGRRGGWGNFGLKCARAVEITPPPRRGAEGDRACL